MMLSQLTIVGAGLIGGSVALAARKVGAAERICAVDRELPPGSQVKAPFDEWISSSDKEALDPCLQASSLTVLCVPVITIIDLLPSILSKSQGPVTDCGSTKRAIVESVNKHPRRPLFVAGHPMAGHPQGGLKHARDDLFLDKNWILCPKGSDPAAAQLVRDFVRSLGASLLDLSVEDHDRSVAITSHLPQVIASSLSVLAQEKDALKAAGPGFASSTRVAGGAEEMWRDIFSTNGGEISAALIEVSQRLRSLARDLEKGEMESALHLLQSAREARSENKD